MTDAANTDEIGANLPYLRRYARALTGSQSSGDRFAVATLEALLEDGTLIQGESNSKVALFKTFHAIWVSAGAPVAEDESGLKAKVQKRLSSLTPGTREVLLLHTMEEFTIADVARIVEASAEETASRLDIARQEMADAASGRVLIIEDETIIAMDLQAIVAALGHKVTGVARTAKRAVELGLAERPDLVLADIHLADDSSGIDAVNELLTHFSDLPVIFITAYPERLLTGQRPEPAFLIAKPFTEEQVLSAVGQAMFFSSTETLVE